MFHLLVARKNRRWLWVSLAVVLGVALFLPWAPVLLEHGIALHSLRWGAKNVSVTIAAETWLKLLLNNQLLLLLLPIAGMATAFLKRKSLPGQQRFMLHMLLMSLFFLITLALFSRIPSALRVDNGRALLATWIPALLFFSSGLFVLYRVQKWAVTLVLLWVLAGLSFQGNENWRQYVAGRGSSFKHPPLQVIARQAQRADSTPLIVHFGNDYSFTFNSRSWFYEQTKNEFYFLHHGIDIIDVRDAKVLRNWDWNTAVQNVWVLYQTSVTDATKVIELKTVMEGTHYQLCDAVEAGLNSVILKYGWLLLDCQAPRLSASNQTESLSYEFHGAQLSEDGSSLLLAYRWTALGDEPLDHLAISHQVIAEDWGNDAQLDLSLVHEGEWQYLSIDVTEVPPGSYWLMAIVYDWRTSRTLDWQDNPVSPSSMLRLREVDKR